MTDAISLVDISAGFGSRIQVAVSALSGVTYQGIQLVLPPDRLEFVQPTLQALTGAVVENGAQGAQIERLVSLNASNPGPFTLSNVVPVGAVQIATNGLDLEIGPYAVDAETTTSVTFDVTFTDERGTWTFSRSLPVTNVSAPDAPLLTDIALANVGDGTSLDLTVSAAPNLYGQQLVRMEYSISAAFTAPVDLGSGLPITTRIGGFTDGVLGTVYVRAVTGEGNGAATAVTATPSNPAPTLSDFTLDIGQTPNKLTWDANESGTFFWMVDTNATRTAAQVIAGGGAASGSFAHTEPNSDESTINLTAVAPGNYTLHVVFRDLFFKPSAVRSTPIELLTGDVTAPVLSAPVGTKTGQNTADGGVTTDEGNGAVYMVTTTAATQPTKAQVKAGQDNLGASAVYSASQSVSASGAVTFSVIGLTANTTYYNHYMHEDANGNQSNVSSSGSFTTDAIPAGISIEQSGIILNSTASSATYTGGVTWTTGSGVNRRTAFFFFGEVSSTTSLAIAPTLTATINGQSVANITYRYTDQDRHFLAYGEIIAPTTGGGVIDVTVSTSIAAMAVVAVEMSGAHQTNGVLRFASAGSGATSVTTRTVAGTSTINDSIIISALLGGQRSGSASTAMTVSGGTLLQSSNTGTADLTDVVFGVAYENKAVAGAISHVYSWTGAVRVGGYAYQIERA